MIKVYRSKFYYYIVDEDDPDFYVLIDNNTGNYIGYHICLFPIDLQEVTLLELLVVKGLTPQRIREIFHSLGRV